MDEFHDLFSLMVCLLATVIMAITALFPVGLYL